MLSSRTSRVGEHDLPVPATALRNVTRTPGKGLRRAKVDENALHQLQTKGKRTSAFPKTPGKTKGTETMTKSTLPLVDKTPFPNQKHNITLDLTGKNAKLLLEPPGSLPRPSSTRKTVKVPRSASKCFETPAPSGKMHWDVSDIELSLEVSQGSLSTAEDDDDDIEYMPPTAVEPPYEPQFDLPDCKQVGQKLSQLLRMPYFMNTDYSPMLDIDETQIFTLAGETGVWEKPSLAPLASDDPFPPRPKPTLRKVTMTARKPPNTTTPRVRSIPSRPSTIAKSKQLVVVNTPALRPRVPPPRPSIRPRRPTSVLPATKTPAKLPVAEIPATRMAAPKTPIATRSLPSRRPVVQLYTSTAQPTQQGSRSTDVLDSILEIVSQDVVDDFIFDL